MLKQVIRLVRPGVFVSHIEQESRTTDKVVIRPYLLSICAADQRYFCGNRPERTLKSKLPMALFHEAIGEVLYDPTGFYSKGDFAVMVPCAEPCNESLIAPNYRERGKFHSSNCDGFSQELMVLPHSQLVKIEDDNKKIYIFAELVSVCIHAVKRWQKSSHGMPKKTIGIWGDGTLSYILALVLTSLEKDSKIVVFGKHDEKLAFFSFVHRVVHISSEETLRVDHAFECVGGSGSEYAIRDIIARVYPQASVLLLGVSEVNPPMQTRIILEKGLTIIGASRSSYQDFEEASALLKNPWIQQRLQKLISSEASISTVQDLEKAFKDDLTLPFKSLLHWKI